ncbi:hypothetical protein GCM10023116_08090 [Kistimonas scapharcae]|uniref:Tetratricopeptide repeat protein n=1 Tax=Kistimonas scapharcae TaxID=1036133 RepID=A0ABP8UXI0_9GAMM|nr:MAG: hypothetical protein B0D91_10895 [Oceanospirillales bacterium LUC14_002_19_P2]
MVTVETLRLLADIGFMATSNGMSGQAKSIFKAIGHIRPNSVLPHIGMALNHLNLNQFQDALDVLEKKALKIEPDNPTVRAFIGMSLMLMGRNSESEKFLTPLTSSDDPLAANLAENLLQELKHHADKKSAPPKAPH